MVTPKLMRRARHEFAATGTVPEFVRPTIAQSWRRVRDSGLTPDQPRITHVPDPAAESDVLRAAAPVLDRLSDHLHDTGASVLIADPTGRITGRWAPDNALRRTLDRLSVAAGFVLSESTAGTNGLDTVLRTGRALEVVGGEHYCDAHEGYTCVGAPVSDPLLQSSPWAVCLSWAGTHNAFAMPAVQAAARDIERQLLAGTARSERALLDGFLAVRRRSSRPIAAVNATTRIAEREASRLLSGIDHGRLWDEVQRAGRPDGTADRLLWIGDEAGSAARVVWIDTEDPRLGVVLEFATTGGPRDSGHEHTRATGHGDLPGLVGSSAAWRRLVTEVCRHRESSLPVLVSGEAGVGKMALAKAVLASCQGRVMVFDAATAAVDGGKTWIEGVRAAASLRPGAIVIRHLELLGPPTARALAAEVESILASGGTRVVATMGPRDSQREFLSPVVSRLGVVRLSLPPLRARPEDIPVLVRHFVRGHAGATGSPVTPEALRLLERYEWPGNVRELENAVMSALVRARTGPVEPGNLPEEIEATTARRSLAHLERVEMETIVSALRRHDGNKVAACAELGISRSTLYRRLRSFGLVPS